MGKRNANTTYTIRKPDGTRVELQSSEGERDLGVKVDNELAFSEHIRAATGKANSIIGMLKKRLRVPRCGYLDKAVCELSETTLEVHIWKPRLRRDIDALERVQKRALRIPYELQKLDG